MRLINTATTCLEEFSERQIPPYAILSHRWTAEELKFDEFCRGSFDDHPGFAKIKGALLQARRDGLQYVWADTCCIDSRSSAELSEAINSMFKWYKNAQCCYAYLSDVAAAEESRTFPKTLWFTRGWTLQELLAPSSLIFFDRDWQSLGDRLSLCDVIENVTGIDIETLRTGFNPRKYSVAQKMSWAANRTTTRVEDTAYCLIGLFNVNMPLLYGEGERAFTRLQEEIIKQTDDHSIFAWSMDDEEVTGMLAPTPAHFADCHYVTSTKDMKRGQPFAMTNRGLSINLELTPWMNDTYLAYLKCYLKSDSTSKENQICIFLRQLSDEGQVARVKLDEKSRIIPEFDDGAPIIGRFPRYNHRIERQLFVSQDIDEEAEAEFLASRITGFATPSMRLPVRSCRLVCFHTVVDNAIAVMPKGAWGPMLAVAFESGSTTCLQLQIGFDFDFSPVCVIDFKQVSKEDLHASHLGSYFSEPWNLVDDPDWHEENHDINSFGAHFYGDAWRDSQLYCQKSNKKFALKGHRSKGMDAHATVDNRYAVDVTFERVIVTCHWLWKVKFECRPYNSSTGTYAVDLRSCVEWEPRHFFGEALKTGIASLSASTSGKIGHS